MIYLLFEKLDIGICFARVRVSAVKQRDSDAMFATTMSIHKKKQVGILNIQGSVQEHAQILKKMRVPFVLVKTKKELEKITHLIIPGGESTTLTKLLRDFDIWDMLQKKVKAKKIKIFGTCAGAIICQKLGMNIKVKRNGYGAQLNSFSVPLASQRFPNLPGVFIRAPKFTRLGKNVEILVKYNKEPVLLRQDNLLVCAFHPELCGETRVHEYFLRAS